MKNVSRGVVGYIITSNIFSKYKKKDFFSDFIKQTLQTFFSFYLTMCLAVICLLALPMIPICE